MAKGIPVKLGGIEYSSKNEALKFLSGFIHKEVSRDERIDNGYHFEVLNDLFKMHPYRHLKLDGHSVAAFWVKNNSVTPRFAEVNIIRDDGRRVAFSYRTAVNSKPFFDKTRLTEAMRCAVESQIIDFRRALPFPATCHLCCAIAKDLHIDHVIPFSKMLADFVEQVDGLDSVDAAHEWAQDRVARVDDTNKWHFTKDAIDFKYEWQEYHSMYAELRPACAKCNVKKSNNLTQS